MTTSQQLRRNRDFVLFSAGRLLSAGGTSLTSIAYPLLVLELTHSASKPVSSRSRASFRPRSPSTRRGPLE